MTSRILYRPRVSSFASAMFPRLFLPRGVLRRFLFRFPGALLHAGVGLRPRGVAGLRRREIETGVDFEDLRELAAAPGKPAQEAKGKGRVLAGSHLVGLVGEALLERALQQFERGVEFAGVVFRHPVGERPFGRGARRPCLGLRRRRFGQLGAHAAIDRAPDRVTGLGRGEIEVGVDLHRLAEFVGALLPAIRNAVDEREVLARRRLLAPGQHAMIERSGEALARIVVIAELVLAQPGREVLLGLVPQLRLGDFRHRRLPERFAHRAASRNQNGQRHRRYQSARMGCRHLNTCRIVTSPRDFTWTTSTRGAKLVLRISILYLPGGSLRFFIGGLTPRDLPLMKTSPQGTIARCKVPGAASADFLDSGFTPAAWAPCCAAAAVFPGPVSGLVAVALTSWGGAAAVRTDGAGGLRATSNATSNTMTAPSAPPATVTLRRS